MVVVALANVVDKTCFIIRLSFSDIFAVACPENLLKKFTYFREFLMDIMLHLDVEDRIKKIVKQPNIKNSILRGVFVITVSRCFSGTCKEVLMPPTMQRCS